MKKEIILIVGFMLAFSILLVACGNDKKDIQVTNTNDKSNFDKKEEAQMKITETEITPNDKGNYSIIGIVDKDASVYVDSEEMEVSSTGMFATASNYTGQKKFIIQLPRKNMVRLITYKS